MTQTLAQARRRIGQLLPTNGFTPVEAAQRHAKAAQIADRHGVRLEYAELLRPGEVHARSVEYEYSDLEAEYAAWRAAGLAQMFAMLERESRRQEQLRRNFVYRWGYFMGVTLIVALVDVLNSSYVRPGSLLDWALTLTCLYVGAKALWDLVHGRPVRYATPHE